MLGSQVPRLKCLIKLESQPIASAIVTDVVRVFVIHALRFMREMCVHVTFGVNPIAAATCA